MTSFQELLYVLISCRGPAARAHPGCFLVVLFGVLDQSYLSDNGIATRTPILIVGPHVCSLSILWAICRSRFSLNPAVRTLHPLIEFPSSHLMITALLTAPVLSAPGHPPLTETASLKRMHTEWGRDLLQRRRKTKRSAPKRRFSGSARRSRRFAGTAQNFHHLYRIRKPEHILL